MNEKIIRDWIPEGDEEILKEITEAYEKNSKEISQLLLKFTMSNPLIIEEQKSHKGAVVPASRSSLTTLHPTLSERITPSSKHSVLTEKICHLYDDFISTLLKIVKAKKSKTAFQKKNKEKLFNENIRLREECSKQEEKLQNITQNYYKELTTLREQIYSKKNHGSVTSVTVRYFSIQQGLSESLCSLLNSRLDELKAELTERIDESSNTIRTLHQEVERYKALTPKDYPLVSIPIEELCKNIKLLYADSKEELWNGIFSGFGIDLILEMIEKATGSSCTLPLENLRQGLEAIRKEAMDQISSISYKDKLEIRELQGKLYATQGLLEAAKKELENLKNKEAQGKITDRKTPQNQETVKSSSLLDVMLKKWRYRSLIQKFCALNGELLSPLYRPESEKFETIRSANVFLQQELNEAKNEAKFWQAENHKIVGQMEEIKQELEFAKEQRRVFIEKNTELELSLEHSRYKIEEQANIGVEIENIEMLQKEALKNGEKSKPFVQMTVMMLLKYSLINSVNSLDELIRKMINQNQLPPRKSQAIGTMTEMKDITHRLLSVLKQGFVAACVFWYRKC